MKKLAVQLMARARRPSGGTNDRNTTWNSQNEVLFKGEEKKRSQAQMEVIDNRSGKTFSSRSQNYGFENSESEQYMQVMRIEESPATDNRSSRRGRTSHR